MWEDVEYWYHDLNAICATNAKMLGCGNSARENKPKHGLCDIIPCPVSAYRVRKPICHFVIWVNYPFNYRLERVENDNAQILGHT